jgi:hypothetical protein
MATASNTTTANSAAQNVLAANASRRTLIVRNQGNQNAYVRFTGAASGNSNSLLLQPGEPLIYMSNPPLEAVSVICPTGTTSIHSVET